MITNTQSGTNLQEIAPDVYRINTPVLLPGAGHFNFNQYLVLDDEPLLFHTGPRRLFELVREAIERVLPVSRLRHVGFSHYEADECGSLNDFLARAPQATPVCSSIAAMVSIADVADRPPHALADGDELVLGRHRLTWLDTSHVPHGWESGLLFDVTTRTLLCGDLFSQGGKGERAITGEDVLGPSEAFRLQMDYYSHAPHTQKVLERLALLAPTTLACMHGSAWRGDGASLLRNLAGCLSSSADSRS